MQHINQAAEGKKEIEEEEEKQGQKKQEEEENEEEEKDAEAERDLMEPRFKDALVKEDLIDAVDDAEDGDDSVWRRLFMESM